MRGHPGHAANMGGRENPAAGVRKASAWLIGACGMVCAALGALRCRRQAASVVGIVVASSMIAGGRIEAGTIVLSQTTSGLTWAPGETGFNGFVDIGTSGGGPAGSADTTVVLEVLAPPGQVFALDGSGYASQSGISFLFRPIIGVSGSNDGWSFSPPTFSLLGASGVSVGVATTQSWAPQGSNQFYLETLSQLAGDGTFTGFRMTTNLTGPFSGQTISFQGGDAAATNTTSISPLDPFSVGPVLALTVVPEPSAFMLALAALVWGCLTHVRRRAGRVAPSAG